MVAAFSAFSADAFRTPPLLLGIDLHPVTAATALVALRETARRLRDMEIGRAHV